MIQFRIEKLVPLFLFNDKNGYAVTKAIEAALNAMDSVVQQGVDCVIDYDTMPEWRLDELAWETNCLYDYSAPVETKREWIKNAIPLYAIYGTLESLRYFLSGYFDTVVVDEAPVYNGEPYHFRVTLDGVWDEAREAWARNAVAVAKNVRSVLDEIRAGTYCSLALTADGRVLARFTYPMTGTEQYTGTIPNANVVGVVDRSPVVGVDANVRGYIFPYQLTGLRPDVNTVGITDRTPIIAAKAADAAHRFAYPMTSEQQKTGTEPDTNTIGVVDHAAAGVSGKAEAQKFAYPMTSDTQQTGTVPQTNTLGAAENEVNGVQTSDIIGRIYYKMCGVDDI